MTRDHTSRARAGRSPPRRQRNSNDDTRENHYCLFCKVQLPSKKLITEHNSSVVHKQKKMLISKAITDGLHFCYTCERIFPTKIELDAHCLMARHQPLYRMDEVQELFHEKTEEVKIAESMTENESRRAKGNKERNDIVLKLNKMREDEDDYDGLKNLNRRKETMKKEHFCETCNVDCLNTSNFRIHLDSWRHRAEIDKKNEEERKRFEEEAEKRFQESDEYDRLKVPENLADKKEFYCEVCSVPLSGEPCYLQHLRGKKHLRQIGQMKRPFKCYVCHVEFNSEKDFNYHLQSRPHIEKAFKRDGPKPRGKTDDWVEKKQDKRGKEKQDNRRDLRSDRKDRRNSRERKDEKGFTSDNRKVEIVKTSATESKMTDLREKLQGNKIVVTKANTKEPSKGNKKSVEAERIDPDKRAKELEIEVTFKKLSREYHNDLIGLKERLTRERESDISVYQQYETTYNKLCQEEDFVRENLRVLDESDPSKEEYIRDMIRIQHDMREVRQELEIREMMIIKRETLFREKFPNSTDNTVLLNPESDSAGAVVIDYHHGNQNSNTQKDEKQKNDADLRIQLERERLLKRLGPELDSVDPTLRDKLLSVILDKEKDNKTSEGESIDKRQVVNSTGSDRQSEIKKLNEREKQLEKELAELKSTGEKKITKSLVPQYDDLEEKNKNKKQNHGRHRSVDSTSSRSSSSSSDSDDRYSNRRSKRSRRGSPSKYRSKKKRKRSTSRDRRKKGSSKKRDDDRKRKSDRSKTDKKKPVKMTLKTRDKGRKITDAGNPLPGDSDSGDASVTEVPAETSQTVGTIATTIPVLGSTATTIPVLGSNASVQSDIDPRIHNQGSANLSQQPHSSQRREQFSFWKNPAVVAAPLQKDSPKEDVWDIAFSGGKEREKEGQDDTINLFSSSTETQNPFSLDILNILKTVAPIIQNMPKPPQQLSQQLQRQPQRHDPEAFYQSDLTSTRRLPGQPTAPSHNIQSGNSAGGRVRSILKKMKEPPKSIEVTPIPDDPVPAPRGFSIPGLESTTVSNETLDSKREDTTSNPLMQYNYARSRESIEKQLYSGNINYSAPAGHTGNEKNPNQDVTQQTAHFRNSPVEMSSTNFDGDVTRDPVLSEMRSQDISQQTPRFRNSPTTITSTNFNGDVSGDYGSSEMRRTEGSVITAPSYDPIMSRQSHQPIQRDRSPVGRRSVVERDQYPASRSDAYLSRGYPELAGHTLSDQGRAVPPVGQTIGRDNIARDVLPRHEDSYQRMDDRPVTDYRPEKESWQSGRELERGGDVRGARPLVAAPYDDRPPVRTPGETEEQFYERFERYYEIKRRREQDDLIRRNREINLLTRRLPEDDYRLAPPARVLPPRDDPLYRPLPKPEDRYNERYRRADDRGVLPPAEYSRGAAALTARPDIRDARLIEEERRRLPEDVYRRMEDDRRRIEERRRAELSRGMVDARHSHGSYERDPFDRRYVEKDSFSKRSLEDAYNPAHSASEAPLERGQRTEADTGTDVGVGAGKEVREEKQLAAPINRGIPVDLPRDGYKETSRQGSRSNGQPLSEPISHSLKGASHPVEPQHRRNDRYQPRSQYY